MDKSNKIFIVGSPRSGTTLFQNILASHSEIISFPESHFYKHLTVTQRRWLWTFGLLGIAPKKARQRFVEYLKELCREDLLGKLPKKSYRIKQYSNAFTEVLDEIVTENRKSIWIEKTPSHLECIELIERLIPEVKFIHVLRAGKDVVASQYDVTQKYPEIWGGARSVETCVERWKKDIAITHKHAQKANHFIAPYEKLVSMPEQLVSQICDFMDIEFESDMLENYGQQLNKTSLKSEVWKSMTQEPLRKDRGMLKFQNIFNESEKDYILNQLEDIEQVFNELCAFA